MDSFTVPRKPVGQSSSLDQLIEDQPAKSQPTEKVLVQPPRSRRSLWSLFRQHRSMEEVPGPNESKNGSDVPLTPMDIPPEEMLDLETHWPEISDQKMRALAQDFHPPTQLIRLLLHGLRRLLLTGALIGSMVVVIWKYSTLAVLSEQDKNTYNFLTIGLSLALGMAIASSLKAMAVNFRWWLLSLAKRTPREVDLILHMDSLTECARLAFHSPRLSLICLTWLALNIGLQVAVAAIGLTYNAETGSKFAKIVPGNVVFANMTEFYTENSVPGDYLDPADKQYTANAYGQIGLSYNFTTIDNLPEPPTLWISPDKSTTIFYDKAQTFWQHNFVESSSEWSEDDQTYITVYTNRSIKVTWECDSWMVIKGGNGSEEFILLAVDSSGKTKNISLPFEGGIAQTTFITNSSACDPSVPSGGCFTVSAFEGSSTKPWYYTCNITVGTVMNATLKEHQIGDDVRQLAAVGIALQGYFWYNPDDPSDERQYQYYPASSVYGQVIGGVANDMGFLIGRFAIGVIAAVANYNPHYEMPGQQPTKASALTVKWELLKGIMVALGGTQAVLAILTSFVANLVVVKDDSFLVIARTLRPLVSRLGPAGSMAGGEEIAEALSDDGAMKVVYSVAHPQRGNTHHLDLGVQKRLRAFPRGQYD